ncbi:glycerophosphodiester phosphodiesterase [Ruoffia sp. FAM 26255]|uniref:glycerophosphodiester phosphodiesterase n=1 Tax=Ruoffia sp. FAM 26255 TaxID=3259519 RepID=UPI0038859C46
MSMIIAHRGYSGKYPENTMLAFEKAYEYGADGIELDIQLTKDSKIVICHDEEIDRTSNGKGFIRDYTLAELREFEFRNNMYDLEDETEDNIKIPTLDEFLNWLKTTELMVNIEFKTSIVEYKGIVVKAIELVKERELEDRVIFSSFNHNTIKEVKELDSSLRCGFLTVANLLNPEEYCKKYEVEYYHPMFVSALLSPKIVTDCKKLGIGVNAYTANDSEHIQALIALNIEGVITNEVELAIQ